jgi:HAD superfamily hydrolase (TIGR01549 family)
MTKDILVFDFDGTVADTFNYILNISNQLSGEFKFKKILPHEVETMKDKTLEETIEHLQVPTLKIPLILHRARKELHKDMATIEPIEGIKEILTHLKKQGFQMGIITNNSTKNVTKFLKVHQIDLFDFVMTCSKIWGKSRSIKKLAHKKRLEIDKIIYIGDETRDIEAARKAGVRIAAVTWGYNSHKALQKLKPDFIIRNPQELLETFAHK